MHQEEEDPSELNVNQLGYGIVVEKDRLTVKYTGDSRHNNDVGAVQANRPVPRRRLVYYYEVHIVHEGLKSKIAVGFAEKSFKLTRQPGWEPGSYGYHGDDGKKFYQTGSGEDYGPRFGTGDVIGAGIHLGRGEMFFTKNGVKLKTAFRNVRAGLYPTVGLHSKHECVEVNFGAKPFRFDLQGMVAEERAAQQASIAKLQVPLSAPLALVADYLRHSAYARTLCALSHEAGDLGQLTGVPSLQGLPALPDPSAPQASSQQQPQQQQQQQGEGGGGGGEGGAGACNGAGPDTNGQHGGTSQMMHLDQPPDATWLGLRERLRLSVLAGDMDAVLGALRASCPQVLEESKGYDMLRYQLYCQKFIELVRCQRVPEALAWAHTALAPLRASLPQVEGALREVVALLAYGDPEASPLAHLLSQEQRRGVAEATNLALLSAAAGHQSDTTPPPQAALARTLQQLVATHEAMLEFNGGQGEPFDLSGALAA